MKGNNLVSRIVVVAGRTSSWDCKVSALTIDGSGGMEGILGWSGGSSGVKVFEE